MNRKQSIAIITLSLVAVGMMFAAGSAVAQQTTITNVDGDTTNPGGQATVTVQADNTGGVTLGNIPNTWSVASSQNDGAFLGPDGNGDSIQSQGSVVWAWSSDQGSVDVSVTLNVPSNANLATQTLDVETEDKPGNVDTDTVDVTVQQQLNQGDLTLTSLDNGDSVTVESQDSTFVDTGTVTGNSITFTGVPNDEGLDVFVNGQLRLSAISLQGQTSRSVAAGLGGNFGTDRSETNVQIGTPPTSVFRGEDINFFDPNTNSVVDTLEGVAGDAEGQIVETPIATDQTLGTYTLDGTRNTDGVVVRNPRVSEVEVINQNGEDVQEANEDRTLLVGIDYNYGIAEPIDVEVFDDSGVDVFNDVNNRGDFSGLTPAQVNELGNYDARLAVEFDTSGGYEIQVSPDGDGDVEDVDSATDSEALTIVSDDDAELDLEQDSAFQGEQVDFEISQGEEGETYIVAIREDRARDEQNPDPRVFRNVGDTLRTGQINGADGQRYFWAELEIDGTTATGRIDTQFLDDTSADVLLYDQNAQVSLNNPANTDIGDVNFELDDQSLDVEQAEITIDSPPRTYVPGQEIDLNGSVSEGVRDVAVFARDRDEWFHVANISVDTDENSYEETNFELSADAQTIDAQNIVGQPGVYRYGVIDILDVIDASTEPNTDSPFPFRGSAQNGGLDSSDFSSGASVQQSLRVAEPTLEADFLTYNGQVFRGDGLDLVGTLIGPRDYVTVITDSRGRTEVSRFTADRDNGEIEEEDLGIGNLRSGNLQAGAVSPGRDADFGDGTFVISDVLRNQIVAQDPSLNQLSTTPQATVQNFVRIANAVGALDRTQRQVREILLDQTVDDAGSDDLFVGEEFRLTTDSRTEITEVVPAQLADNVSGIAPIEVGETMVIRGETNRNPDESTIVVEATEGPSLAELGVGIDDNWNDDREPDGGEWSVEIEVTEQVEPGNYTIQSDDGERVDEQVVEVVAEGTAPEPRVENVESLRQRISELEDEVEFLRGQRDQLNNTITELEQENDQLRQDLEEAQSQDDSMDDEPQDDSEDNESEDDSEEEQTPGFTAVAALISLVAVALLALRRKEE